MREDLLSTSTESKLLLNSSPESFSTQQQYRLLHLFNTIGMASPTESMGDSSGALTGTDSAGSGVASPIPTANTTVMKCPICSDNFVQV